MVIFSLSAGCSKTEADSDDSKGAARVPNLPKVNRTFDPDQVVKELEHIVETRRTILAKTQSFTARRQARRQLVDAFLSRASFLGDVDAYDEALAVADEMAADPKEAPSYHLYRARVMSSLHRFDEATRELDQAEVQGVASGSLELQRIRLLLNRGKQLEALERLDVLEKREKSLPVISTLAVTLADLGRREAAERQFSRGVSAPTLVDPLPVAYLWFQQGLMYEREGERSRAADYYRLALARFPYYPAIISHLAAIEADSGDLDKALVRLRALVKRSGDPEYLGQLSKLLDKKGAGDEAKALAAKAETAYEALLAKHPLAFADHAARFFLDAGKADRALALAALNLENRPTDEAYQLYLDAAHAAGKSAAPETCTVAARAVERETATAYALFVGARALRECGKTAEADAAMSRAKTAKRQR